MSLSTAAIQPVPYSIIGQFTVDEAWNGSPLTLEVNQNANMPQTPDGTTILSYQNLAAQNNHGEISITSGGSTPEFKPVPALTNQPEMLIKNWKANNLSVTNISANSETPIRIQAVGPGMPGTNPLDLPIGTPLAIAPGQTAQTNALPQYMQLIFKCTSGQKAIFVLIGGPPDETGNNGYAVMVNDSANTGPPGDTPPPQGYYATTKSNAYTFSFNWGSSVIFVANMSGTTSTGSEITLRQL